jgi:hypothetical protein
VTLDACESCHTWIPADATAAGFAKQDGQRPMFKGSLRPLDLLSTGTDAHARIWRDGYDATAAPKAGLRVSHLGSGCLGCHALASERHGNIPSCTDCHSFGTADRPGSNAAAHAQYIADRRSVNDPAHVAETNCIYCHGFVPTAGDVYRPACYNCHLSAHRPVAVFWP